MPGNAWIHRGHPRAPLVANLMQVRVTDPAIQNLNLHIVLRSIAPRNRRPAKRRFRTSRRISFCFIHNSPDQSPSDLTPPLTVLFAVGARYIVPLSHLSPNFNSTPPPPY